MQSDNNNTYACAVCAKATTDVNCCGCHKRWLTCDDCAECCQDFYCSIPVCSECKHVSKLCGHVLCRRCDSNHIDYVCTRCNETKCTGVGDEPEDSPQSCDNCYDNHVCADCEVLKCYNEEREEYDVLCDYCVLDRLPVHVLRRNNPLEHVQKKNTMFQEDSPVKFIFVSLMYVVSSVMFVGLAVNIQLKIDDKTDVSWAATFVPYWVATGSTVVRVLVVSMQEQTSQAEFLLPVNLEKPPPNKTYIIAVRFSAFMLASALFLLPRVFIVLACTRILDGKAWVNGEPIPGMLVGWWVIFFGASSVLQALVTLSRARDMESMRLELHLQNISDQFVGPINLGVACCQVASGIFAIIYGVAIANIIDNNVEGEYVSSYTAWATNNWVWGLLGVSGSVWLVWVCKEISHISNGFTIAENIVVTCVVFMFSKYLDDATSIQGMDVALPILGLAILQLFVLAANTGVAHIVRGNCMLIN